MSTPVSKPLSCIRRLLTLAFVFLAAPALAQTSGSDAVESESTPQERLTTRIEELEARVSAQRADIELLAAQVDEAEGLTRTVLEGRLDEAQLGLFETTLALAREADEARDQDMDVSADLEEVAAILQTLPSAAVAAIEHIQARAPSMPESESPADTILADQQLALDFRDIDEIYDALIDYLEVAERFDVDVSETRDQVSTMLAESAANRSVYLEVASLEAGKLRTAVETLANDDALSSRLSAMEIRARVASEALESSVELMNRLDLETNRYRQQLLSTTGQISTDVLDVGFLANLVGEWTAAATDIAATRGPTFLFSVFLALVLVFVFMQLGKLVQSIVARGLRSDRVHVSSLLERMILSTVRNVIVLVGVLVALSQLGISLGPLLAGLGIAGFILGFALQDTLSNFASGLMILFYRPFDVGDFVEVSGVRGKVHRMSMVNTTFLTVDNQKLVVPNNIIWQSVIANYTDQATRRVDLVFGISYGDDIDKAEEVIREVLSNYDGILDEPAPVIKVGELADSSVNLIVRPWVATENYWDTYWDLTKMVKQAFDREGISIPFPQRDVHMIQPAE